MQDALDRGVKMDHLIQFQDSESIVDFDIDSLIARLV